ncbi:MAG TPA: hypothetical protein PLO63_13740 [Syntrophales bacterium]|nr:hypothetical protein [Syntrophales bacterium]
MKKSTPDPLQTTRRKIILKRQAVKLINDEIRALRFRQSLLQMKAILEGQMTAEPDTILSRKLDCLVYLLEA